MRLKYFGSAALLGYVAITRPVWWVAVPVLAVAWVCVFDAGEYTGREIERERIRRITRAIEAMRDQELGR